MSLNFCVFDSEGYEHNTCWSFSNIRHRNKFYTYRKTRWLLIWFENFSTYACV